MKLKLKLLLIGVGIFSLLVSAPDASAKIASMFAKFKKPFTNSYRITDPSYAEKVVNGTFIGADGWTYDDDYFYIDYACVWFFDTLVGTTARTLEQQLTGLVKGARYKISFTRINNDTATIDFRVGDFVAATLAPVSGTVVVTEYFIAPSSNPVLQFSFVGSSFTAWSGLSTVSIIHSP